MKLDDKVVIITGASRGIGQEIAFCMHSDKATDKGANSLQIICAMQEQLESTSGKTKSDPLAFIRKVH
ncbi:hypothetical protein DFQ03_2957 [Maribacter caenipelagi]|uniref:Uncharacterized protein n=1 Tax=Maribacter caenipelagi TaxID=1447781 RepID=A0A4R7D0B9_9FLAO|nr:SDR family oxidoreductase [Maribacter caenipelagi]TDS13662.1 hypothetical protein DFQ03_2957 [Maribacter caenipelagi]